MDSECTLKDICGLLCRSVGMNRDKRVFKIEIKCKWLINICKSSIFFEISGFSKGTVSIKHSDKQMQILSTF